MKLRLKHLYPIVLFILWSIAAHGQTSYLKIENYQVYYGWAKRFPQDWMIIRRFEDNKKEYLFLVNPQTLETKIDEAPFYQIEAMTLAEARNFFRTTPYIKAINKAEKQSVNLQDAGIESGMPKETGISLTADLCPSHRPLDRVIFTDIFKEFQKVERPVPVALSVTGVWMRQHPQDLEWLKQMQRNQEIYITWINHSFNHRVSAKLPLKENFLLEAGTDISYEQLVYRITDFGLIPIGTDAWLAKGQEPQAGSIVLIHGNGNEPVGVHDFINLLKSKTQSIAKKQWLLYDLRESVDEEFQDVPATGK
eukprot:gene14422-14545_t